LSACDWNICLPCHLQLVPPEIGVNLEIRYTSENDAKRHRLLGVLDLNRAVDAVLHAVYEAAREQAPVALGVDKRNRKVIFSGYDSVVSGRRRDTLLAHADDLPSTPCY
jgi:zona occludens toxin (predicted ATPase)